MTIRSIFLEEKQGEKSPYSRLLQQDKKALVIQISLPDPSIARKKTPIMLPLTSIEKTQPCCH